MKRTLGEILAEYKELKKELFGNSMFVIPAPEDKEKWERYNLLQGILYPYFKVKKG